MNQDQDRGRRIVALGVARSPRGSSPDLHLDLGLDLDLAAAADADCESDEDGG